MILLLTPVRLSVADISSRLRFIVKAGIFTNFQKILEVLSRSDKT